MKLVDLAGLKHFYDNYAIKEIKVDNTKITPVEGAVNIPLNDKIKTLLSANGAKDLGEYFASEIANYSNQWQWIKARIQAGDFTGINIGDYLTYQAPHVTAMDSDGTITKTYSSNVTFHAQVAGINSYYNMYVPADNAPFGGTQTSGKLGNHIDFFTKECCTIDDFYWADNCDEIVSGEYSNNGTASQHCPYINSQIGRFYQNYFDLLPNDLKAVIIPKAFHLESRYSSINNKLTECDSYTWNTNLGKCWTFSEYELTGSIVWGSKPYSAINGVQYPLFKTDKGRHFLHYDDAGDINDYAYPWTLTTVSGSSYRAVCWYGDYSRIGYDGVDNSGTCPLGFRIGVKQ